MLTRLRVSGFKNLVDTEVRFGPFTCVAGFNGVGKSNVFDAIRFLALLADHTFVDAARQVRGGGDPSALFTAWGDRRMHFECDLVIRAHGRDDFHQVAEATHTFLTYTLELQLFRDETGTERIQLVHESLTYVPFGEAKKRLAFGPSKAWIESAIRKPHRKVGYIETEDVEGQRRVRLSADKMRDEDKSKRGGGRPSDFLASTLPRTVLSAANNAEEARTAVLVRSEMRSWRVLQLEPSALRLPDDFHAPASLTVEGRHLPATLQRLSAGVEGGRVLADISNRLSELVSDVRDVRVVRDDTRRAFQLVLTTTTGQEFSAASLSDGTLRFIALSVLERDPEAAGLFCLEEPENGIHPERMSAMMRLLADMATNTAEAVDDDNPLQQVIVSTHSPIVVAHARADDLLFADHRDPPGLAGVAHHALVLRPCADTWRTRATDSAPSKPGSTPRSPSVHVEPTGKGKLIEYLGALEPDDQEDLGPTAFGRVMKQLSLRFGDAK
jgi:predicted ATPase